MFYTWNIELAVSRTEATKQKTVLHIERGTIIRCEVSFPSGCCGLVFTHINQVLHQVYPKNPGYQYSGNGETIVSSDEYEIKEEPFQLEFYGWNTDDVYTHTITVRIQLVPKREIIRLAVAEALRFTRLVKPS